MSVAPDEFQVAAARDGWLANPNLPVPRRDPLVLPRFGNTSDPGWVGIMRELNRVIQPSEESISSFDKLTGTVAALAAGLDPAEKEQVWNIGEDNTPEDVVEYTDILEEFWDVVAWNMAEMTTIKDKQFSPVTDPAPVLRQQYRLLYAERKSWQSRWKNVKRLDSLDLQCRNTALP
jgi:hypothetical protein